MPYDYSAVAPGTVTGAVDEAVDRCRALAEEAAGVGGPRTFDNTLAPLEEAGRLLGAAYGRGPFLGQVSPDGETRRAARRAEERMGKWALEMTARRDLFRAVSGYAATEEAAGLSGERARVLEHALRDFRMAGHELSDRDREGVRSRLSRLVEIGVAFAANLAEYEDALQVTEEDLEGLPPDYVARLSAGDAPGTCRITMDYPDVIPFMENSPRRRLREALAFKFGNRARESNTPLLEEALRLRAEIADLFGAPSWAHHAMREKMAARPAAVEEFYDSLLGPLTEAGLREREKMETALAAEGHAPPVSPWDRAWCHTEQLKREYGVDPLEAAAYFPLESVLDGLFEITQTVFGLRYEPLPGAPVWHPDVRAYRMTDAADGSLLAHFYMDLHPRPGKFGHAAVFPLAPCGRSPDGRRRRPECAIVANFTRPSPDRPSLLLHDEVVTLFHEFGHVLHMSLAQTDFARFASANTEPDFVEAPSQIMENWCWEASVLASFARHYQTGRPIPEELVNRLAAVKNLNAGLLNLRQIMLGRIDLELHSAVPPADYEDLLRRRAADSLLPYQEGTFFLASFGHLLGGYDAGYYGYLWSQVFGADMFSRFAEAEEGVLSPRVGMEYRRAVLEPGGSRDAARMLRDFLGRPPNNEAFLRHLGLRGD